MPEPIPDWMQTRIDAFVSERGSVPPPWDYADFHPMSMFWRMGDGEAHRDLWWTWWEQQKANPDFDEAAQIACLLATSPPPRWLGVVVEALWEPDLYGDEEAYAPWIARLAEYGFADFTAFMSDLDDPRWFEDEVKGASAGSLP